MSNSLKKKILISGFIKTLTGLHIGGTNNSMSIGDLDNAVIRHPITKEPYIPGSSLKGKMRSLLEITREEFMTNTQMGRDIKNTPSTNPNHLSAQLFGYTNNKEIKNDLGEVIAQQPSRLIVRDAVLDTTDVELSELLSEIKAETVIDRLTAAAMPRQLERIPSGTNFKLDIVLNIFQDDLETQLTDGLFRALLLVQDDYLGGAGSRGSGQVKFEISDIVEKSKAYYTGESSEDPNANKVLFNKSKSLYPSLFKNEPIIA